MCLFHPLLKFLFSAFKCPLNRWIQCSPLVRADQLGHWAEPGRAGQLLAPPRAFQPLPWVRRDQPPKGLPTPLALGWVQRNLRPGPFQTDFK